MTLVWDAWVLKEILGKTYVKYSILDYYYGSLLSETEDFLETSDSLALIPNSSLIKIFNLAIFLTHKRNIVLNISLNKCYRKES